MAGGPAITAVVSSALMGSVTGSAMANVATTGAFTIPLMKKVGYRDDLRFSWSDFLKDGPGAELAIQAVICVKDCPGFVLEIGPNNQPRVKYADECWHCANCRTSCPCSALGFEFPIFMTV